MGYIILDITLVFNFYPLTPVTSDSAQCVWGGGGSSCLFCQSTQDRLSPVHWSQRCCSPGGKVSQSGQPSTVSWNHSVSVVSWKSCTCSHVHSDNVVESTNFKISSSFLTNLCVVWNLLPCVFVLISANIFISTYILEYCFIKIVLSLLSLMLSLSSPIVVHVLQVAGLSQLQSVPRAVLSLQGNGSSHWQESHQIPWYVCSTLSFREIISIHWCIGIMFLFPFILLYGIGGSTLWECVFSYCRPRPQSAARELLPGGRGGRGGGGRPFWLYRETTWHAVSF